MAYSIFQSLAARHAAVWRHRYFAFSVVTGWFFLAASLLANYGALVLATKKAGIASPDILLDFLPVVNTDIIFSQGAFLFLVLLGVLFLSKPRVIPYALKSIALFVSVRSAFVVMTHLGPIPEAITTDLGVYRFFTSGADLFFSGHTGLPFLLALLFWEDKFWRWFFLASSLVAGAAVLLGHLHYTIDVFSAFFIVYGINRLAQKFFARDRAIFNNGL